MLLYRTLGMLGVSITDDETSVTMDEVEVVLRHRHPSNWELLYHVIQQMNELTEKIAIQIFPESGGPVSSCEAMCDGQRHTQPV